MILSSETRVVMIDLLVDTSMMLLNHCFCPISIILSFSYLCSLCRVALLFLDSLA